MAKLTAPVPTRRAYALETPSHLPAALKRTADQGTAEQRKKARDFLARRYPALKNGKPDE